MHYLHPKLSLINYPEISLRRVVVFQICPRYPKTLASGCNKVTFKPSLRYLDPQAKYKYLEDLMQVVYNNLSLVHSQFEPNMSYIRLAKLA